MNAWKRIAGLGFVIGTFAVACTITEGDGDIDGIGGASTTGGSSTGGTSTGGSSTGGTSTGGATTGGTGGAATGGAGTGGDGGAASNACTECLVTTCATEFTACGETTDTVDDSGAVTANGTADCIDEFVAYQSCIETAWEDDGLFYDEADCDGAAVLVETGDPLPETNALINCVVDVDGIGADCIDPCLDFSIATP